MPCVIKAQVPSGNRKQEGGILFARDTQELTRGVKALFNKKISGQAVQKILIEQKIPARAEYYISFSYDTDTQGPVFSASINGGSGIHKAKIFPVNILLGVPEFFLRSCLSQAGFLRQDIAGVSAIAEKLWRVCISEYALVAEINPLFVTKKNEYIAGDAKIILDDEKYQPAKRRFIEMQGDIAILASGGGASLVNIDALLTYKGRPANYTEYSGNPKGNVVKELTKRVLSKKGLKGCWVVGGTANFTDIYETMRGFVEGLREVKPKPRYPIVIRRDGPRQKEAFAMLKEIGQKEGYDFHLFDSSTPMAQTAKVMVKLAYGK